MVRSPDPFFHHHKEKWKKEVWPRETRYIYKVLDGAPANVMCFCTKCEPKVKLALKFFTDIQQKQQAIDDKLKQLEEKFSKSISDINTQLGQKTNVNAESAI